MSVPTAPGVPARNRLLAALPPEECSRLLPHMETVPLIVREPIYASGEPIAYAYFPLSGVISLVVVMADGTAVEIATIGNEGMAGHSLFLGVDTTPGTAFSQVAGEAVRIKAGAFKEEVSRGGAL